MSQPNPNPNSSQPCSDESSLHYHRCWWAWCRHNFYTKSELLDHITLEHVQKARPERLRDIPAHKLAEDDYWDSQELPCFSLAIPSSLGLADVSSREEIYSNGKVIDSIPSSLPSPPASTPNEAPGSPTSSSEPANQYPSHVPQEEDIMAQSSSPPPELPTSSPQQSPQPHHNRPSTPLSKSTWLNMRTSPATFISLSSQPNSPGSGIPLVPDSSPFQSLVDEAMQPGRSPYHLFRDQVHHDEDISRSEKSSCESVLEHLTQGIDKEEAVGLTVDGVPDGLAKVTPDLQNQHIESSSPRGHQDRSDAVIQYDRGNTTPSTRRQTDYRTPAHAQQTLRIQTPNLGLVARVQSESPSLMYSPTYSTGSPAVRQPWYQAPRRRKASKKIKNSESHIEQAVPRTHPTTISMSPTSNSNSFRTKTMQSSHPMPSVAPISQPDLPQLGNPVSQTLQGWTDADSQIPASYPPLQTQAPYRSQSLTQD